MIKCEICGTYEPKSTPSNPKAIWRHDKTKKHIFCGHACRQRWWRVHGFIGVLDEDLKTSIIINKTGFPMTPKEKRIWFNSGKGEAIAARYKFMCQCLGILPPTLKELDNIKSGVQINGFCLPNTGDNVYQLTK